MIHEHGKKLRSPGGSFVYEVQGPICRLFDREELPGPAALFSGAASSRPGDALVAGLLLIFCSALPFLRRSSG